MAYWWRIMREIIADFLVIAGVVGITYGVFFIFGQGWAAITGGGFSLALGFMGNYTRGDDVSPD